MIKLPFKLHMERRPRPLPQEFNDLVLMVDQLAEVVNGVRKMAEATQRKVYYDITKNDGQQQDLALGTTAPAEAEWRTGDPEP